MSKTSSRTILLRYVPILAVLCVDLFFLAMLENLFVNKKRALIIDSFSDIPGLQDIVLPFQTEISRRNPNYKGFEDRAIQYLESNAKRFIEDDHPWFRVIFTDEEGNILFEEADWEKMKKFNNWTNCLFTRTFAAPYRSPTTHVTIYYASPIGWKPLEAMVAHYRIYAVLFVLGTWVAYYLLSRNVFRPMLLIHDSIEKNIRQDRNALIAKPKHDIEDAFNRLVRNQREVFFSVEIDQLIDRLHSISDDQEAVHRFLESIGLSIQSVYPFQDVQAFWLPPGGETLVSLQTNETQSVEQDAVFGTIAFQADLLNVPLHWGESVIGVLHLSRADGARLDREEWLTIGREIQKQAEHGITRCMARSRTLTEERNRFGINLATNMGHDLTNIIASGKWDLETIHRAHSLGIVKMDSDRGKFFLDAVEGLRNNLRFLQQMVDIYRSFGYTQNPHFEQIDLGELVKDLSSVFRLSTSQKLSIEVDTDEDIAITVEPRLLRMMLFNLLANAAQAIVRSTPPVKDGRIRVTVRKAEETATIRVSDNGPGIRDGEGRLMAPHEIIRIFTSGYSTKGKSSGGGLGLSWVKSIVEDFHHGTIAASNRPEGGAEMTIRIPIE